MCLQSVDHGIVHVDPSIDPALVSGRNALASQFGKGEIPLLLKPGAHELFTLKARHRLVLGAAPKGRDLAIASDSKEQHHEP